MPTALTISSTQPVGPLFHRPGGTPWLRSSPHAATASSAPTCAGRLDHARRSAGRTGDPAPRPARPLRRPPPRARPRRLPRHGRHHRGAAHLRPPRAGSNSGTTRRAAGFLHLQPDDHPRFPSPAPIHVAPPGRLTARSLLRRAPRPPDVGGDRRCPPRTAGPTGHRQRGASPHPRRGPCRSHPDDARRLPPDGSPRQPWSSSAAATTPGPSRPWGASAATRSGTPFASSSPTSTTQRTSSPTTPPPRSPTWHSTGSGEPHDGWRS